jgi:2-polyprenyl-3-methyl-5-hydroxy-6-metoxy-1,4-benzoquinol methylase
VTVDSWNHNIHYHALVLGALPPACNSVLDVGCGEGELALELTRRARRVVALDRDRPTVERARAEAAAAADNIEYVVGDFLTHPFTPGSFDAITSVAALHHMDTATALRRMRDLLRPGGTLVVVGLARSRSPSDLAYAVVGAIATRLHRLTKTHRETSAPKIWPPPDTFRQTRRTAARVLPGVRYRRHVLWRYSLVWTKPPTAP